mgnify:CR=1 FL=1
MMSYGLKSLIFIESISDFKRKYRDADVNQFFNNKRMVKKLFYAERTNVRFFYKKNLKVINIFSIILIGNCKMT